MHPLLAQVEDCAEARSSPRSTAPRWAAGWSSRWPVTIASPCESARLGLPEVTSASSRRRGNAAAAAPRRRGEGARHGAVGEADRRARRAARRARRPHRRRRSRDARRSRSRARSLDARRAAAADERAHRPAGHARRRTRRCSTAARETARDARSRTSRPRARASTPSKPRPRCRSRRGAGASASCPRRRVRSEPCKALLHVFLAERAAAKIPGVAEGRRRAPVERVAIVGAGTMGGGIAMACANAGIAVRLRDATPDGLDAGMAAVRRNYDDVGEARPPDARGRRRAARAHHAAARRRRLRRGRRRSSRRCSRAWSSSAGSSPSSIAWRGPAACSRRTRPRSTSTRSPSATSRPESVVGLHFFSPANVMRLLEIVRGDAHGARGDRHRARAREAARQGRRGGAQPSRLHREPDDVPVHVRDAVPRRGGRDARAGGPRADRVRDGDGDVRRGRHGGARRRMRA